MTKTAPTTRAYTCLTFFTKPKTMRWLTLVSYKLLSVYMLFKRNYNSNNNNHSKGLFCGFKEIKVVKTWTCMVKLLSNHVPLLKHSHQVIYLSPFSTSALSMTVEGCNLLSNEMVLACAVDFVREKNRRIFNNIPCPSMPVVFGKL